MKKPRCSVCTSPFVVALPEGKWQCLDCLARWPREEGAGMGFVVAEELKRLAEKMVTRERTDEECERYNRLATPAVIAAIIAGWLDAESKLNALSGPHGLQYVSGKDVYEIDADVLRALLGRRIEQLRED